MFGSQLGQLLGSEGGKYIGKALGNEEIGRSIGGTLGGFAGKLLPFKKGGRVKGVKGRPVPIMAHAGEYVLPTSIKPTKAQVKAVNALHKPKTRKPRKSKK
jgi:hypothetical protein